MDPTQRTPLPPHVEERVRAVQGLTGAARADALRELYRDFPAHAAALAALLSPDRSQVVTGGSTASGVSERLSRLAARGSATARYELHGEVARGGMGAILRAYDQDLGRTLAMKVVQGQTSEKGSSGPVDPQVLERFVEEAQITGQLDHPGVVPVHELGLDENGRAYFTMRLVKGITAQEVFDLARRRDEGWTLTRALEVLLKVCDTLAYAHSKGVVHRDLKPSNVMVGKYGEVYVMDWGLAKVLGQPDPRDLRIRPQPSTTVSRVRTDRSKENESDSDTALRTMDGAIVGTPCYMPPEQAHGRVEDVGVRSDVYAAGAMLYSLLTGTQPYIQPGSPASPYMVLEWVRNGPPPPIQKLDRTAPVQLVAICEHAMAREVESRYAGMRELADDLRAFLENRVVRAYRTGARAELALWIRRNRGMAAGLLAAMLAIVLGGASAFVYAGQANLARKDAELQKKGADALRVEAEAARKSVEQALAALQAEQKEKEELEGRMQSQRNRADWKEAGERLQREAEEPYEKLRLEEEQRIARLHGIGTQLRTLAGLLPAVPRRPADAGGEPLYGRLFGELVAPIVPTFVVGQDGMVTGESFPAAWQSWAHGRCLVDAGQAEAAVPILLAALQTGTKDNGKKEVSPDPLLEGVLQRALADAYLQLGRPPEAFASFALAIELLLGKDQHQADEAARDCAAAVVRTWNGAPDELELGPLLAFLDQRDRAARANPWDDPVRTKDVGTRRLSGVVRTVLGRLREGSVDLGGLADAEAGWLPMLAMNQSRLGRLDQAIESTLKARAGTPDQLQLHGSVVEEARAWRALHRPQAALDLLAPHRARLSGPLRALLEVEVLEVQATCQADLARFEEAQASLAAAIALLPAGGLSMRSRLATRRGHLLLQLGRADAAVAAFAGVPAATTGEAGDLRPGSLLDVATAAERAGRRELADACLARIATLTADKPDEGEVALVRMRVLHGRGQSGDAARLVDPLQARLPRLGEARSHHSWFEARAHVLIAEVKVANDLGRAAMPHLDQAARAVAALLRDHARFQAAFPSHTLELASLGQAAIATFIRMAPQLVAADAESAWRVLETFRALPSRVALTRPATLADAAAVPPAREDLRDEWEQQRRERLPAYASAVHPRVGAVTDLQQVMPAKTALVVFAVAGGKAIAFVVTPTTASLVPLPMAASLDEEVTILATAAPAERHAVLGRLGASLVDPVLASLAAGPSVQTLLLAPVAELCSIPFELCTVNGPPSGPLIAHRDVAYVPSGTACYDQLREQRRLRLVQGPGGVALMQHATGDPAVAANWIAAAMHGVVAEGGDDSLLQSLAAREPVDWHSCSHALDLFVGAHATTAALAGTAAARDVITLSLDLECPMGAPQHAALRCANASNTGSDGLLTMQDLRDLRSHADFALVHNGAAEVPSVAESQALLAFANGLWSGGIRTVVTAGAAADASSGDKLVRAFLAARRAGTDGIGAFSEAFRRELAAGSFPAAGPGVRLWCVKQ